MLTRIVNNSDNLTSFVEGLLLDLSEPQKRHLLNLADGLLVCEDEKTLAALQRQFIEAADASNWADFLRISPWNVEDARERLRRSQLKWLIAEAERRQLAKVIFVNIDDSIGEKDKQTSQMEPVDWHHDHNESTKNKPRFKKGVCYLACTVCIGELVATVDLRLYLREKTVRRINRQRTKEQCIPFRSKISLAQQILRELQPHLPKGWTVYVQFDSWYAAERLLKFVHRQGWHVTCGLKCNRKLNDVRLDQLASALRHKHYMKVRVAAADGNTSTYYVRIQKGRLVDVPFDVRVLISKRHPREQSPAYFMSTDLARTPQWLLRGYRRRWSCEVDNFYLKTQLGLADFRVRSYEAVDKYLVVVLLTWAFVESQFTHTDDPQIKNYGDVIRRHRDEHAHRWLSAALDLMQQTADKQLVLHRFLRLAA